jgi:heme/copper-type cytochrome/quinol oxidase subunit 1
MANDPDTHSAEARPPRAPVEPDWTPLRSSRPARIPTPPGEDPVLEFFQYRRRFAVVVGLSAGGLILLIPLVQGAGREWLASSWVPWGWVVGTFVLFYWLARRGVLAASRDWLAYKTFRTTPWVRLDELVEVSLALHFAGVPHVKLVDSAGRTVGVRLADVQANRDLWDLVYAGILRSMQSHDVKIDDFAHHRLQLPR